MPTPNNLMGSGLPSALAGQLGMTVATAAGVGTAQATATSIPRGSLILATTAGGATAFVLSSLIEINSGVRFYNMSSTTALVFPPSGGAIDNGSTDASVSIAQNRGRLFIRTGTLTWISFYGA